MIVKNKTVYEILGLTQKELEDVLVMLREHRYTNNEERTQVFKKDDVNNLCIFFNKLSPEMEEELLTEKKKGSFLLCQKIWQTVNREVSILINEKKCPHSYLKAMDISNAESFIRKI